MGHRANYVVIENGKTDIYYTHWGAVTAPAVLLSGPENALKFARVLKRDSELMEIYWAQGGVFLDYDNRQMSFFHCLDPIANVYVRRQLVRALQAIWSGWTVSYEAHHQIAFHQKLGLDPYEAEVAKAHEEKTYLDTSDPLATETDLSQTLSRRGPGSWITMRTATGQLRDWMFYATRRAQGLFDQPSDDQTRNVFLPQLNMGELSSQQYGIRAIVSLQPNVRGDLDQSYNAQAYQILSMGPDLLNILPSLKPFTALPQEGSGQEPHQGAFIDEQSRTIWFWENYELYPHEVEPLARRWPDWQVHKHADGMIHHLALSGRSATLYKVPDQRAIKELIDEVASCDERVNPALIAAMTRGTPQAVLGKEVKLLDEPAFARGFFRMEKPA